MRCAEVNDEAAVGVEIINADNLHRQFVRAHQSLRRHPRLGTAAAVSFIASKMVGRREPSAHRKAADIFADVGGRPDAFGDLVTRGGREQHLVADLWRMRARV